MAFEADVWERKQNLQKSKHLWMKHLYFLHIVSLNVRIGRAPFLTF